MVATSSSSSSSSKYYHYCYYYTTAAAIINNNTPRASVLLFLALLLSSLQLYTCDSISSSSSRDTDLTSLSADSSSVKKCRTVFNNRPYLCTEEEYNVLTSFSCYYYLPPYIIPPLAKLVPCVLKKCGEFVVCKRENATVVNGQIVGGRRVPLEPKDYNISDEASLIYKTFLRESDKAFWRDCHKAAMECCTDMLDTQPSTDDTVCPRTWDSWQCFGDAPAGKFTDSSCPDHIYFRSEPPACPAAVRKYCSPEGKRWAGHDANSTVEWTNYGSCLDVGVVERRHVAHIAAHVVSILALLPAVFIFFYYKQLHVHRISMHRNLFISLLINGIVFITFKKLAILDELEKGADDNSSSIVRENTTGCKILFILTKYTRSTNYLWMLCEGFYLHKLIVAAFAEQKHLKLYYLIGWVFPIVPVVAYVILRATNDEYNERCWTYPIEKYEWIVNGPNLASLVLNLFFLCNIIRVLLTKLKATNSNEPNQYRKAVKATLLLVPLFGLHFMLTIVKPKTGPCKWLEAYHYINYLMDGLQGLVVALTFCYFNREVIDLLKRSYRRWKTRRDPSSKNSRGLSRYSLSTTQIVSLGGGDSPTQTRQNSSNNHQVLELNPRQLEPNPNNNKLETTPSGC